MSSTLSSAVEKPRVCLVRQQYRRLTNENLLTLSPTERASCLPINFSSDLAIPKPALQNPPTLVVEFYCGEGKQKRSAVMLAKRGPVIVEDDADDDGDNQPGKRIEFTFHSSDSPPIVSNVTSHVPSAVLLDRLFGELPEAAIEEERLTGKLEAFQLAEKDQAAPPRWLLPRELGEVFATILQNHLRLHVMLNAGALLTQAQTLRPILVAPPTCSVAFANTQQRRFVVTMWLHRSSATCCCSAHGLRPDTNAQEYSGTSINVSVCGHKLCPKTGRCPLHPCLNPPEPDPICGQYCLFGPKIQVRCVHSNTACCSKQTLNTTLDVPPHILPTLLMTITASMLVTETPLNRDAVAKSVKENLDEADVHLLQAKPGVSAQLDVESIRAIQAGIVLRGPPRNGRATMKTAQRGKELPNAVKRLKSYTSLFKPCPALLKKRRRRHATPNT
jgi:hypothetical protein